MMTKRNLTSTWVLYSRLFTYIKRYWPALVVAIMGSMLYSGIDAWFVHFLQPLLNKGLLQKDPMFLKEAPLLVLMVFILRGFASFLSNYFMALISRNVIMNLRQAIFIHLQKVPASFYDKSSSGQILSVLLYTVEQIANAGADVLTTLFQAVFLIIGLLIVMFKASFKLTLLYFIILPIITIIMRITSLRVRRLSLRIQHSMASLTHIAEENIEGYKVVRSYGGQNLEMEKFNKAAFNNRQKEMKIIAARSLSVSFVQFVAAIALAVTLFVATLDISHAILSPGSFIALIAAMLALLKPMKDLTNMQNKLYRGLAGAETIFQLLDEPIEADEGIRKVKRVKGKIDFKEVNFSYLPPKKVLNNISFSINPSEVVAFVGRSGSGKSTLINLLMRFYNTDSGTILLDDHPIFGYNLSSFRNQFALVSQHITLFNDTILNNIAYGRKNKTQEEIVAAAKAAHALEFISELKEGMHTLIGENGITLSGGQRQRIAIARAILKDAPILILDEATSSLDTESERYIQQGLTALMQNRTTLVIAHRLSTIENADKIIVLQQGELVEMGNHHSLLKQHGYYTKLYQMQFKEHGMS